MRINLIPFMESAGLILGIVATVLICLLILPEKKYEKLPKAFKYLHDLFNFKTELIEKLIKLVYVFATVASVLVGIALILGISFDTRMLEYGFASFMDSFVWTGIDGIKLIIVGPIVSRIVFEALMLFVKMAKNIGKINDRINGKNDQE